VSTTSSTTTDRPFPWVGLSTLAVAIFVLVTSEFLPTGLLPAMARDLGVSESQIGFLVTIFAGTVVVSAAPLAALTRQYSRKSLLLVVLVVFALSNLLAAISPNYEVLVGARVLGGLAHGLFWAVAGAYAGHLVPRHQLARAVAVTNAGGTTAFVLGVPLGTALGFALGWRAAFGVIAVSVLVLVIMVWRFLPPVSHHVSLATGEIRLPARRDPTLPAVLFVCLLVVLIITGHNVFYTFIAPFLLDTSGFSAESLSILLFLYGGAGAIGLVLAGVIGSRYPRGGLYGMLIAVIVAVLAIAAFAEVSIVVVIALVVWGAAFGGLPTLLQTRMLHAASPNVRDVGAALLTTAFNIGIGGGAAIGAVLFERTSPTVLPVVEAATLGLAIIALLIYEARRRSQGLSLATRPVPIVGGGH